MIEYNDPALREERVNLRLSFEERAILDLAARASGMRPTTFARMATVLKSSEALRKAGISL
jgi:uncharacterized protein (DUF1778 family)